MRLFVYALCVGVGLALFSLSQTSTTKAVTDTDKQDEFVSACSFAGIDLSTPISAESWQIVNLNNGEVIASHEPGLILPFASVVKLLTAEAVLQYKDSSISNIMLTSEDILTEGRAGGLEIGEEYTSHGLLFPLLLTSSNDAGAALARKYPDIVFRMQAFVDGVGASRTTVADTTGLSLRNTSTAHDLSLIVQALYLQSPHILDITKTSQIISSYDNGWINNIPFRKLDGYVGGKQGYLPEAGQTGVAIFKLEDTNETFGIVILASASVAKDMEVLYRSIKQSYMCTNKLAGR